MKKSFFTLFFLSVRFWWQLLIGSYRVMHTKGPRVTIFGGSRIPPIKELYQQAHALAQALAHKHTVILTGGGPGVMEAASCGTTHVEGSVNLGIGITSLHAKKNVHLSQYIEIDTFFVRKYLLINFTDAFIVFPGGYGTLDELMELLNLIKVNHIRKVPVILVNKAFWSGLINWIHEQVVGIKAIQADDIHFMHVVDTNEEALTLLSALFNSKKELV